MKEIVATNANFHLAPANPPAGGPLLPRVELVLITSEPRYAFDEVGTMLRLRRTETLRFSAAPAALRTMAAEFVELADLADELADAANGPTPAAPAATTHGG